MKLLSILLSFSALFAQAQTGILKESLTLSSKILGHEVKYSIYLPAGYEISDRNYPVLYLLHGYTDDDTGWVQFGEVQEITDASIENGNATPMIIAMPDAGVSWYINSSDKKVMYEDFFIKEFIPFIDKTYKTRPKKEFRAVAGLSMGGHGTFIYAFKHPDMFAAAAPLSAGVLTEKELIDMKDENWDRVWAPPYGKDLKGNKRITDHMKNNWALSLIESTDAETLKKVRYYIDCGDDDFLIKGNMAVHEALIDKKVPHEFRVRDGGHSWEYWRTALPEVLSFISQSFHR